MGEKTFEADEGLGVGEEGGGLAKGRFATKIGCARHCGVGRTTELNDVNFGTELAGDLGHAAERPLFGLKRDAGGLHATLQNNLARGEAAGCTFDGGEVEMGSEGDRAGKASEAAHLGDEVTGGPEIAVRIVGWVRGVVGLNHATAESAQGGDDRRERSDEVDFVLSQGDKATAIEVKSGRHKGSLAGLKKFTQSYQGSQPLVVGTGGISVADFLLSAPDQWL